MCNEEKKRIKKNFQGKFYRVWHFALPTQRLPFLTLNTFLQDTLCLIAPYLFHLEPLEDLDQLTDFDMTGDDDVWFAQSQLFCVCSLCPTGQMEDKASSAHFPLHAGE